MFPRLQREGKEITSAKKLRVLFFGPAFSAFTTINVLPLIYGEKKQWCNVLVFDGMRAGSETIVDLNCRECRGHASISMATGMGTR